MNGASYRDVLECADMEALETNICTSVPSDPVTTDTKMPGGSFFDLMSKMRRGEVGDNPFVPVIMLARDANADVNRNAAACGVDDILAAPISPADLFGRIKTLVSK